MHLDYTNQSNSSQQSVQNYKPVTVSFNKIINQKQNQFTMNSLIKKSKNVNGSTNNQKLLNQLQSLIGNHDVMKNMSVDLQKRLQKVLAIAKQQQSQEKGLSTFEKQKKIFRQQYLKRDQNGLRSLNQTQIYKSNKNNQINSKDIHKSNKLQKIPITLQTFSHQELFPTKKQRVDNKQNYHIRSTLNLRNNSNNKNQIKSTNVLSQKSLSKEKKQPALGNKIKQNVSQKSLFKHVKNFTTSNTNNKPTIKIVQLRSKSKQRYKKQQKQSKSKQKICKVVVGNKKTDRNDQKSITNTIKRFNTQSSKHPYSLNTTQFTTRNLQAELKSSKQILLKNSSEKLLKQKRQASKIKKLKTDNSNQKISQKQIRNKNQRHHTQQVNIQQQQDQNLYSHPFEYEDQQLFIQSPKKQVYLIKQNKQKSRNQCYNNRNEKYQSKQDCKSKNKKRVQNKNQSPMNQVTSAEQSNQLQFVQKITKLQKQIREQEQQLQHLIKLLKNNLSTQKFSLQCVSDSISKLKQEQKNLQLNNSLIINKKKQSHKKLQHVWIQVKNLNNSIFETNKQNQQVLANLQEQKQLVQMYNTVIQQLKQQLKIQIDDRDQFKKMLKQSKKSQVASRIKANSTKQKTQYILGNIRQSMNKWG